MREPNKPGRFVVAVSVANQITFAFASGVATKPPYKIIRLRILGPPMVYLFILQDGRKIEACLIFL